MYSEYLFNNDTQEISNRVCEMASSNEPALRAHCQEVSRQTDTSSLALQEDCIAKLNAAKAILQEISVLAEDLSKKMMGNSGVFGTQNGQATFPEVCRSVMPMEEKRQLLISCVADLSEFRRTLASRVADTNRALHFLYLAKNAVDAERKDAYAKATEIAESANRRLKTLDASVFEMQNFCMTFIEKHFSVFMQRLRISADFNHAGNALATGEIRMLCSELKILVNRAPNITF
ncbi:MAG: hypothetical protein IKV02_01620 [Clostridia bacterium]|nr:hypothetical protein [Clostridia bacterium]